VSWTEPALFVWGLFALTLAGALLPLDVGRRHREHVVLTITATAELAILGPRGLVLVWGAVAAALVASAAARRSSVDGAVGMVTTATAVTVGFALAYLTYVVALGRRFPVEPVGSSETAVAGLVLTVAWVGTMSVRVAAHGLVGRTAGGHGLDPFDSPLVPYLLPLVAGAPLVAASLALHRPDDPWPALAVLVWSLPLYAVCRFDLHRRDLAQRLRREAEARQRLVAIGRATATVVHQSRHHAGVMGWSIHRLRRLLDDASPDLAAAATRELDALSLARLRIQQTFESELLHEHGPADRARDGAGGSGRATGPAAVTLDALVRGVVDELADEARRAEVQLDVAVEPAAGAVLSPPSLRDALVNLVDNALGAATTRVTVSVEGASALEVGGCQVSIEVRDDGPGLPVDPPARVFEPFFSTKDGGAGMGLAIADALVGELGGQLCHRRRAGTTSFVVTLPVPEDAAAGR
jgi:hypothetical protein